MSYDLHFFKLPSGRSAVEYYENADWEDTDDLDPKLRIDIRRLADELLALNIGLEEFKPDLPEVSATKDASSKQAQEQFSSIELNTRESEGAPIQLFLDQASVAVTLPYWNFSAAEVAKLSEYWSGILPVLKKDLAGYDPQTGCEIGNTQFSDMMGGITEMSEALRNTITQPKKPWWKFW